MVALRRTLRRAEVTPAAAAANSVVRLSTFGVLKLTLGSGAYSWQFVHESGNVLDQARGPATDAREANPMTEPAQHGAMIRQFYAEVFNAGNVAFAERVHGPGYRYHDITVADGPVDHTTYMARNAGFASAFPDRRVDIEDLIATGDRVVARALMHATHTGPLGDVGPTGRRVRLASTIIYRFAAGRVVEEWEIFDKLGMYQQLGVTPPSSPG